MKSKHFYYFSLLALTVQIQASGVLKADVNLNITTTPGPCTGSGNTANSTENTSGNTANSTENTTSGNRLSTSSNTPLASTDSNTLDANSTVERVVLKPGKHFLITVDPCAGGGNSTPAPGGNFPGISLDALNQQSTDNPNKPPIIVPQRIVPAAKIVELSADDARIQELIDQQPNLEDLSPADLNTQTGKYIKFLNLLRKSQLNQQIKLARLVFVGEDDGVKYRVIEKILGVAGCLEPAEGDLKLEPRFAGPLRFTLKNNPSAESVTFKILGSADTEESKTLESNSLYKALKAVKSISEAESAFKLSDTAVEIEIEGPELPSLVFMDLPWKAPQSSDQAVKSENDTILSRLLYKYLEQPWGVTVAIGPGTAPYDRWQSLSLVRTFDANMRRVMTVVIDPPARDVRLQGIALGLQEALPAITKSAMFYLNTADNDSVGIDAVLCSVAKCGPKELIYGLQRKLLRTWNAMKPDAMRIITAHLEKLRQRVAGYEGYKTLDEDGKWKALVAQSTPILQQNLIFALEDRDPVGCTGSPLDLIKEPLLTSEKSLSTSPVDWNGVFASFQREVSNLPQLPATVEWDTKVRDKIAELKRSGPSKSLISDLKRLVLSKQLEALAVPRQHLLQTVQVQFQRALSQGLNSKAALEAFPAFKAALLKAVNEAVFDAQMTRLMALNAEIDESDSSVGWIFDFTNSSGSLWIDLMKSDSIDSALESFRQTVERGFVNICTRQAFLQPRLIISQLLSPKAVKGVEGKLQRNEELMKLSTEAEDKLKGLNSTIKTVEELVAL